MWVPGKTIAVVNKVLAYIFVCSGIATSKLFKIFSRGEAAANKLQKSCLSRYEILIV